MDRGLTNRKSGYILGNILIIFWIQNSPEFSDTWGRFHEKSQTEPDSRLSQGFKSETFVSAEFLAQMDFTKGGSAETSLKLWSQLFNLISYI